MVKAMLVLESGASFPIQIRQRTIKHLIYAMAKETRWRRFLRRFKRQHKYQELAARDFSFPAHGKKRKYAMRKVRREAKNTVAAH